MATNLDLDDRLIEQAVKLGDHKTKRQAVNAALKEYVQHRRRLRVLDLFGAIDYDPAHNYKLERRRAS
jgi:Arc/MetJ family transcription regulator